MNETLPKKKKNSNEVKHIFMHLIKEMKIIIIVVLCYCTSNVIFFYQFQELARMWNRGKSLCPASKNVQFNAVLSETYLSKYVKYTKTQNQEKCCISVQEVSKNIQNNIGHKSKYLDPNNAHQLENV